MTYWTAPKEKRVSDLINTVWQPRLVASLYGLAYFINGYTCIAFSIWIPFFLFKERSLNTIDIALFVGLIYVFWSWKMFIGIIIDAFPIRFKGKLYRRLPWFLTAGMLYLAGTLIFLFFNPLSCPFGPHSSHHPPVDNSRGIPGLRGRLLRRGQHASGMAREGSRNCE